MARLLVVDDDPDILEALTLALEDDHDVQTAEDGREALERLVAPGRGGIELVVLDLMMPHLSGSELVHALRDREIEVPIILISAMHDLAERAAALGAADHLDKPFRLRALRATVTRVLARRAQVASGSGASDAARVARGLTQARLVRVQRCSLVGARGTRAEWRTTNEQGSQAKRARRTRS